MLKWALAFFIVAIMAGFFGFGGITSGASQIARVLLFFFVVISLVSLVGGFVMGRRTPLPPV